MKMANIQTRRNQLEAEILKMFLAHDDDETNVKGQSKQVNHKSTQFMEMQLIQGSNNSILKSCSSYLYH